VLGWKWFPLVLLLDIAKGAVPVALIRFGLLPLEEGVLSRGDTAALAGLIAMLGHLFPIYLGFRGGKGVAIGAGVIGVLLPLPTLIALAAFLLVLAVTRYVSLSSIVAAIALIIARFSLLGSAAFAPDERAATAVALFGAALIIIRHRSNLSRLLAGTEPKLGQAKSPPSASPVPPAVPSMSVPTPIGRKS
jgi:glycerol-3-phosphate acyltransferase PlsY